MIFPNFKLLVLTCVIFILIQFDEVHTRPEPSFMSLFTDSLKLVTEGFANVLNIKNPITPVLCDLRTDKLIEYYGYEAEEHKVITEDGYILTMFRCNSKIHRSIKKKPVILQHGLLASSDDFVSNIPEQSLSYILADSAYDVWIPNSRGNTYSRNHITKDPDNSTSGFWDFSWYEMGIYDHPAVFDYILNKTESTKLYYVGHSQGTATLLVLLSEKPEYNEKVHAASLMAPVSYMNNSDYLLRWLTYTRPLLELFRNSEFLPRESMKNLAAPICEIDLVNFCGNVMEILFGPSDSQRNDTMLPALICHTPIRWFIHKSIFPLRFGNSTWIFWKIYDRHNGTRKF
ncbi:lipase 1-like isoform X2 [Contarinia nasturtii]|uniref:lipase 1-like isoform X2 n=1 Tax=Contarinia nasturtii TaxID=265458 RepID=UPI0012D49097|nr:lipase 1-like isoform X2 [Contarinia nasturtii]